MSSHFKNLLFYIPKISQGKILDVGAGRGKFLIEAAKNGSVAFGLEKNQEYINKALLNAKAEGVVINLVKGEAENLPLSSNDFDFVNLSEVIEHVNEPQLVLREVYRVLKNQGFVYISVPNRFSFYDTHYHLYFVNWLPRKYSEYFIRFFKKNKDYSNQEAGLQKLKDMHYYTFGQFKKFAMSMGFLAEDMREIKIKKVIHNSILQNIFLLVYRLFRNFYFKTNHFLLTK